jgi:hypothetical protein
MTGFLSGSSDDERLQRLTETCRRMLAAGGSDESILAFLRRESCWKVASIRVLAEAKCLSLSEAKALVHRSATWSDVYERDEAFHDTLEEAVGLWQREENWRAELERVFDVVSVDESTDSEILRGFYWEGDAELVLTIDCEQRIADVEYRRQGAAQRFRVSPLGEVRARTASHPYRLDLDKPHGGRLTLWFKPLGCTVGGCL